MQPHFADEWQRLTRSYSEKTDEELLELSADFVDLTEAAQQALRDELRTRHLPAPTNARPGAPPLLEGQGGSADAPDDSSPEYTWKTLLCECHNQPHAWQISQLLKDAGIESWIELPRGDLDLTGPRLLVAADQLDEARAIAERPIPQEIVDQSRMKEEDFSPPLCPKCGAADPLLLAVEPANTWRCDVCGTQWTDSVASPESAANPSR